MALANYVKLFNDPYFYTSLGNTVIFSVFVVPASIVLAMGLAILLNNHLRGNSVYGPGLHALGRAGGSFGGGVGLDPQPQWGLLNGMLRMINIQGPPWLSAPDWASQPC